MNWRSRRAGQQLRDRITLTRDAKLLAEQPFQHQREAKCQQQAIKGIEPSQASEQGELDQHPEASDDRGRQDQGIPEPDAKFVEQKPRGKCAHHVQRTMSEVHDVKQTENHCQAQAKHRVERAVDQAEGELA